MASQLRLSLIAAPDTVRLETREVEGYEFTLGRGQDADWSLLDPDRNILSRHHCSLVREDDDWWVEDLSGNGTYLNHDATPIGPGARKRLRDGDRVRLGPYEFQVRLASEAAQADLATDARDHQSSPDPPAHATWAAPAEQRVRALSPFEQDADTPAGPVARAAIRDANPFLTAEPEASDWSEPASQGPASGTWPPPAYPPPSQPSHARSSPGQSLPAQSAPGGTVPNPPFDPDPAAHQLTIGPIEPAPATRPVDGLSNPFLDRAEDDSGSFPPLPAPPPALIRPDPAEPSRDAPGQPPTIMPVEPRSADGGAVAEPNPFAEPGDQVAAPARPEVWVQDRLVGEPAAKLVAPLPARPAAAAPAAMAPAAERRRETAPPTADHVADRLLSALLQGAGMPDAVPRDPEQAMRALGEAVRAMVKGVRDAQRTRRSVRGEFRIAQTSYTQNPLKVAVSDDDALEAMLGAGRRGPVTPARAVEEILREIVQHEMATFTAMQDAVRVLIDSLSPERLRAQADQAGGLTVVPALRKARAWDLYEAEHARVHEALRDDFDSVFGKAFARAYERVMAEQGP